MLGTNGDLASERSLVRPCMVTSKMAVGCMTHLRRAALSNVVFLRQCLLILDFSSLFNDSDVLFKCVRVCISPCKSAIGVIARQGVARCVIANVHHFVLCVIWLFPTRFPSTHSLGNR